MADGFRLVVVDVDLHVAQGFHDRAEKPTLTTSSVASCQTTGRTLDRFISRSRASLPDAAPASGLMAAK